MTNRELAMSEEFLNACEKVGLTKKGVAVHKCGLTRQAGKWRRKTGLAYKEGRA